MKGELIFEEVKNSKEFKKILIGKYYDEISDKDSIYNLEEAFKEMETFEEKKEKTFMRMVHFFDNQYKKPNLKYKRILKINAILNSAIYISRYYDKIKKYNLRELALLSNHSVFGDTSLFDSDITLLNKNVLSKIINRDKSFTIQSDLIDYVDYKINNEGLSEEQALELIETEEFSTIYDYILEKNQETWYECLEVEGKKI